jgi:outer membrane protein OmpA-like peptidoglycan-associated protein/tetratricopeptide (TPR) repeat protein
MKKITTLIILTISFLTRGSAQEQLNKMQLADNLFDRYEYFKSVAIYLDLANKSNPKLHAIERVADCYRLMNDYDKAEQWYQKTVGYPEAEAIDHYYYAELLLRNKKFGEAREQYKAYYALENADQLPFKLAACDSAQKWIKSPVERFTIKNEQKYNTKYSEWGLNFSGKTGFVFTSDRLVDDKKTKKKVYNRTGDGFFKMYKNEGDIIIPLELKTKDNPIFDANYHVGPMVFTNSGDTAYITITTTLPKSKLTLDYDARGMQRLYTRRLQLIVATKVNGQWANFKNFQYNNIQEFSVGHATLSKNGNVIYFASDMTGGEGKTDIWYCVKQTDGEWAEPVNCGKLINTKDDEAFPNLSDDGVLYYSSTGLPGMGGLDIFKSKGEKSSWAKPVNLKYPVNSTSDDFYFITRDSLSGYFSSNRENGKGNDDIYSFGYTPPPSSNLALSGNPSNGKPGLSGAPPPPMPASAILTLKKGEGFILNNIYYDLNKFDIRADAAVELTKLATILREHPTIRIEVGSHTDARAPSVYNLGLSKKRAASAVNFLVNHGVSRNRLVAKGYGDTQLLNQCAKGEYCSEEDHQINRRTEIHVLSQ